MISTKYPLTLKEFLALPKNDDIIYELVDGQAKPKIAPRRFNALLTEALSKIISRWSKNRGLIGVDLPLTLKRHGQDWVPVPNFIYISYIRLSSELTTDELCPLPPDLVIEIVSHKQTFANMLLKAQEYLKAGVMKVWVIDAREKTVTVFYPNTPPQTKIHQDSLADAILPELEITSEQIFQLAGIP